MLNLTVTEWKADAAALCAGFDSVADYYAAGGSYQRVPNVQIPLLVIQAEDDPIAPIRATPKQALFDNPNCILAGGLSCIAASPRVLPATVPLQRLSTVCSDEDRGAPRVGV